MANWALTNPRAAGAVVSTEVTCAELMSVELWQISKTKPLDVLLATRHKI